MTKPSMSPSDSSASEASPNTDAPSGELAERGLRMPAQRMPAEWEPHAATWLAWPHNLETWPGSLARAEDEFEGLIRAIARFEPVHVLAPDAELRSQVERRLARGSQHYPVYVHEVPTDDSWLRDTGPTFAIRRSGELVAIDWIFNAWGGKYAPWDRDAAVASHVARIAGVPRQASSLTLEGGALEVDGEGTLLATRSCVIDPARNPGIPQERIERELRERLGLTHIVWVEAALAGDDTDGHIDNLVRFVAPGRVVCICTSDPRHVDHAGLSALRSEIAAARDARGRALEIIDLPLPPRIELDGAPLPASYANFLIVNGGVIAPTFDVPSDEGALELLRKCFPARSVVGVPCRTLVRGFGGPHCLSQQQPRVPGAAAGAAPVTKA